MRRADDLDDSHKVGWNTDGVCDKDRVEKGDRNRADHEHYLGLGKPELIESHNADRADHNANPPAGDRFLCHHYQQHRLVELLDYIEFNEHVY